MPYELTDEPATWGTKRQAQTRADQLVNGTAKGRIGIVLGDIGDNTYLCGADLDSSLDQYGALAPWAAPILAILQTYAEISPSGLGLKAFFFVAAEHVRPFLDRIGVAPNAWGTKRGIPSLSSANHGPAIEIYTAARYF